jgi:hypothetical protein
MPEGVISNAERNLTCPVEMTIVIKVEMIKRMRIEDRFLTFVRNDREDGMTASVISNAGRNLTRSSEMTMAQCEG